MKAALEFFRLEGRVSRIQYLATGVGLGLIKYGLDAVLFAWATGEFLGPIAYLDPTLAARMGQVEPLPSAYLVAAILWAMPFLWIGIAMSSRRARDAALSPWIALGFLIPYGQFLLILGLCLFPTRHKDGAPARGDSFSERYALIGIGGTTLLGVMLIGLFTEGLGYYGSGIFLGLPFVIAAVTSYLHNLGRERSVASSMGLVVAMLFVGFSLLIVVALEGAVCLAMASPVMLVAALPGAVFGRALARLSVPTDGTLVGAILFLPLGSVIEQGLTQAPEREVMTVIEIDAAPEVVWEQVVSFGDLPKPDHWLFDTGIAYPLRARIDGQGVGAIRYCEFTTGDFVEPITVWDEPERLAFDVREQPDAMEEWSFYAGLRPPHLDHSFRSLRGEFKLIALPQGGTRLEGRTWYRMEMGPASYWQLWGDWILHRIHGRVLEHVRRESMQALKQSP